jgi:hypothetical protein
MESKNFRLYNFVGCKTSNDHGVYQITAMGGHQRVFDSKEDERIYNLSLDEQIKCNKPSNWHDEKLVRLSGVRSGENYLESKIKGVKLSFEWFKKLGFEKHWLDEEKHEDGHYYFLRLSNLIYEDIGLVSGDKNGIVECVLFPYDSIRFKYVHEVQNIYHAITGKELSLIN